ncbi:MAG TPA: endonuclease/exonuclease/phosphatase family protein [Burkholderiales bacterium]
MLRLLSLNLNYRVAKHGTWAERCARIVETVERHGVDVMALQAVEGEGRWNQAQELAERLDFGHVAFVAATQDRGVRRGSAFISRFPLDDVAVCELTRCGAHPDPDRRLVLRARVRANGSSTDIYNAHFSWVAPQAVENARETLAFRGDRPGLLLGDLNSAPDSAALGILRAGGWIDAWAALRGAEPGYTFEADRPAQRIDYVLATEDARPRVHALECVGAPPGAPVRLSDHLALLVTLDDGAPSVRQENESAC